MGLKLSISDGYGNTAEYIKLSELNMNYSKKTGRIVLEVWKNRETSKLGTCKSIGIISCSLRSEEKKDGKGYTDSLDFAKFSEKSVASQYTEIKKHKLCSAINGLQTDFDFSSATDVFEN